MTIKVLFVCLGNICRSPMAEGGFKNLLIEKGFQKRILCDSAGTSSYHIGEPPDSRMCQTASGYNIHLDHRARQLVKEDFEIFHYILAMDRSNLRNIQKLGSNGKSLSKIFLFRDFDPEKDSEDVPDPYYGGQQGFEEVFRITERCNRNFLDFVIREHQLQ